MLIVKVCHQGEIKRVAVPLAVALAELRIKLATLFGLPTGTPVILKYLDDENDLITLGEDEELQEAVRLAQRANLVLRVHMFLPNQPMPAVDFRRSAASSSSSSAPVPSLLSSQLPQLTSALSSTAAAAVAASPSGSSVPVSLSVIVVEHHHGAIAQRTATLSSATSALVEKNAAEVTAKTQQQADQTATVVEDLSRQTSARVEQLAPALAVSVLADRTANQCEGVAQVTTNKVNALADVVAVEVTRLSEKAAQPNPQIAELDRRWAVVASDTAARVNELSAALVQRLMNL
jgi:hypothetical protein